MPRARTPPSVFFHPGNASTGVRSSVLCEYWDGKGSSSKL